MIRHVTFGYLIHDELLFIDILIFCIHLVLYVARENYNQLQQRL